MSCLNLRAEPGAVKSVVHFASPPDTDRVRALTDAERGYAATGRAGAPWVVRVPVDFLDARYNGGIGHRLGWMLLILEGYCRARAYCWTSNAELAAAFGCSSESTVQNLLAEMVKAGLIHRVLTVGQAGRHRRVGIILLKRANPDLPVAGPEGLPDVIRLMKAAIDDHRQRKRGQRTLPLAGPSSTRVSKPSAPSFPGPSSTQETGCGIKTLSSEGGRIGKSPPSPHEESLPLNDNDRTTDPQPGPPVEATVEGLSMASEPFSPPFQIDLESDPTFALRESGPPRTMAVDLARALGDGEPKAGSSRPPVPSPAPSRPIPRPMVSAAATAAAAPIRCEAGESRDAPEASSRGGDRCGGTGLTTAWHSRPDPARRIPEVTSASCARRHGRWIERNHRGCSPELRGGWVDLAAVPGGRSEWQEAPPEPASASVLGAATPGKTLPGEALTPGQLAWRETLTGDQLARLEAIPVRARERLLRPHREGFDPDPILAEQTRQALAPKSDSPSLPSMPSTLEGMLTGLRGAPADWALHAAELLTRALGDRHSWRAHRKVAEAVWRGELAATAVLDSLGQALKPGVKNRGAVFTTAMKEKGFRWVDR